MNSELQQRYFTKLRISVFILEVYTGDARQTKQIHVIIIGFEIHISDTISNKENSCGQACVCVCVCVCEIPYSVSSIVA
jgi:hypothetical protein